MHVPLRNNFSGQVKLIKIGWSWTLFPLGPLFGFPLFIRRLPELGIVAAIFSSAKFTFHMLPGNNDGIELMLGGVLLVIAVGLGINGNCLTGVRLIERGWSFAEPTSQLAQLARANWGLAASAGMPTSNGAATPDEQTNLLATNIALGLRDTMLAVVGVLIIGALFVMPILYYAVIAFLGPN